MERLDRLRDRAAATESLTIADIVPHLQRRERRSPAEVHDGLEKVAQLATEFGVSGTGDLADDDTGLTSNYF
jgi:hypothetical protein